MGHGANYPFSTPPFRIASEPCFLNSVVGLEASKTGSWFIRFGGANQGVENRQSAFAKKALTKTGAGERM
jgi:hypothetical protein